MKKLLGFEALLTVGLCFLGSCGNQPANSKSYPKIKTARSLSEHYVLVEFEEPAGEVAADPSKYLIVDPELQQLAVETATLSADGLEATLTTVAQSDVGYQIAMGSADELLSVGRALPIGTLGFYGSSQREPFLESAVSLSSTQILLTFSQQMDEETTETVAFYENMMKRMSDSSGWKEGYLKKYMLSPTWSGSKEFSQFVAKNEKIFADILKDLGLTK